MKFGAGIGILSLLLTTGIMLWLFAGPMGSGGASYGKMLAEKNREAREDVQQFSGKDIDGRRLSETLTLVASPERGSMRGVLVSEIEPNAIAATHFGLVKGDVIRQIGPNDVGGFIITSVDAASDFLDEAFAKSQSIVVDRDGQELTLPTGPAPAGRPALPGGVDGLLGNP
ncbi:MAG: hypothetical protein AAGI46_10375 [Planctomycetota bacterium]